MKKQTEIWNEVFSKNVFKDLKLSDKSILNDPILNIALEYFGSVKGKTVLDLGAGNARSTYFFAYHGASVVAIDTSKVAIDNIISFCEKK